MAMDTLESSLSGEARIPQLTVPFSSDLIKRLRVQMMQWSGAYNDEAISQQIRLDTEPSIISEFVTTAVVKNKQIRGVQVVASLEKEQLLDTNNSHNSPILDIDFFDFVGAINDFNDQLITVEDFPEGEYIVDNFSTLKINEEDRIKIDKLKNALKKIFKEDPILQILQSEQENDRALSQTEWMAYQRAILTQKTILVAINSSRLGLEQ